MSEDKKYIYVSKEFADKYEELGTAKAQAKLALEIIETKKLDVKSELSQLDDDLIRFKASCLVHRSELERVYEEQYEKMDKLIRDCWDVMPIAKKNAQKMAGEIQPFADQLINIESSIVKIKKLSSEVNFYGIENVLQLAQTLSSVDDKTKDILHFMAKNFSKES